MKGGDDHLASTYSHQRRQQHEGQQQASQHGQQALKEQQP